MRSVYPTGWVDMWVVCQSFGPTVLLDWLLVLG